MQRGESSLAILLGTMKPILRDGAYAFCLLGADEPVPAGSIATFVEDEGRTAIVPLDTARRLGLEPLFVAAWITLSVHSDLDAVGFLAAVMAELATAGISCNAVSAVHHDHLFVPHARGGDALQVLSRLSRRPIQST